MTRGWLGAALKRVRTERFAALGLAALVLVTAFVFSFAPRALDETGDRVLRSEVGAAVAVARNIQLVEEGRVAAGATGDPMAQVVEHGQTLDRQLPDGVRGLVAGTGWQAESARYEVQGSSDPVFLRLRWQEGIDEQIRYLEGRAPAGATETLDDVTIEREQVDGVVVYEAALARRTAEIFRLAVGETAILVTDPSDSLAARRPPQHAAIRLVGIYEAIDPAADYWLGDAQLQRPVVRAITLEMRFYDGAALLSPAAYPAFLASGETTAAPLRYTWRRFVDPARLESDGVGALLDDLRRAQVTFPSTSPTSVYTTGYRTGLLGIIERQQAGWAAATAILAVVAIGPAVVAAAALGLVALLAAQRRRIVLALARSRGASDRQLLAAVLAEAAVVTLPAVALAALAAAWLVPGGPNAPSAGAAAAVAVATTLILVATSVAGLATERAARGRLAGIDRFGGLRRLVAEALLIAVALGAAWLLRERGVRGVSSTGALETADPLIAAVPALVGLAAGVVAVRLFPLPMRLLAWLAASRRDLVPVLAMRRATGGGGAAPVLAVLLATATIGAFSAAALVHLDRAAETVGWQEVGAPYRLSSPSGPLPGALDPDALPDVEASAGLYQTAVPVGLSGPRVELLVADTAALTRVVGGTPADPDLPNELLTTSGGPIPTVVSRSLGERPDGVREGETFSLSVEGYTLEYRAVEVRDAFPGMPAGSHFVVASRSQFLAAAPSARLAPTAVLLRAPDASAAELRAVALDQVAGGSLESRAERSAAVRGAPVVGAVRTGVTTAATVAATYAALAVAAALALGSLARAVEVAHLRTLGLTRRQAFWLGLVEHGPTVATAFAAGLGLGLGLFLLLRPGLGLSALVGSPIEVPLAVEAGLVALVLAAILAIVILGVALGALLQRATTPVAAIRRGFE